MPPGTPEPRLPPVSRDQEIVCAAIDVFGDAGFAGARIDEVARRVGLRRPSILYHFSDKMRLYEAALTHVVAEIAARLAATESSPIDRLDAIADAWIDFVVERPSSARLLLRQLIDGHEVESGGLLRGVSRILRSIESAISLQLDPAAAKAVDAAEFALILSSASLVWVASQKSVEGALGLDTLAPRSVQRHRSTLRHMIREQISQANEASRRVLEPPKHAETRSA